MRVLASISLVALLAAEGPPQFEIADVHVSAKTTTQFMRTGPVRGGRYEIRTATMVDLIRVAYGFDPDKILGGPSWLEMDRYDVIANPPAGATPDDLKIMLQALLADRFKLVVHKDAKPLPAFALTAPKKPKIKEADGSGDTGCRAQAQPGVDGPRLMMNGNPIPLGPGMSILYSCRNMTMAAFAEEMRSMIGNGLGASPVVDQTGLAGRWNFDIRFSLQLEFAPGADAGERVTLVDGVDKQLGLKLEQQRVPTPVIVVDSVNETPSANPPGVAEALPVIPAPTEFEVAVIKPSGPDSRGMQFQIQPGGRVNFHGATMRVLVNQAFGIGIFGSNEGVTGLPKWSYEDRFDITATAPSGDPAAPPLDMDSVAPMLRALLADRFKLKSHTEQRPVSTYNLVAAKPRMTKADPANRTGCRNATPPPGTPPALSRMITCQNTTMAQFADQLRNFASGYIAWPVTDATGLEGAWDFTLNFSPFGMGQMGGPGRGEDASQAADPSGAVTLFEALEKQLGLKLEAQKRPMPVVVIDSIQEKPTDNQRGLWYTRLQPRPVPTRLKPRVRLHRQFSPPDDHARYGHDDREQAGNRHDDVGGRAEDIAGVNRTVESNDPIARRIDQEIVHLQNMTIVPIDQYAAVHGFGRLFRYAQQNCNNRLRTLRQQHSGNRCAGDSAARGVDGAVNREGRCAWDHGGCHGHLPRGGTRMRRAIDRLFAPVETDQDACKRGDEQKRRRVNTHHMMRIETDARPRSAPLYGGPAGAPEQNQSRGYQQTEQRPGPADHLFADGRPARQGSRIGREAQMQLMDEAERRVACERSLPTAENGAVVRIDSSCQPAIELHQAGEIRLAEELHRADMRGGEALFHNADQILFG